jgi:hypothetical protein
MQKKINTVSDNSAQQLIGKNSPIITGNKVLEPFKPSNINNFQPIQSKNGDIQNTLQSAVKRGGRKTKSIQSVKRQRKPRTKKCLITKGNQMYMSFCV